MKMNWVEKLAMNNPVRAALQRHVEAPLLERLGGRLEGARVLEIGCGRGIGTELLLERFGARQVHSIDVDPEMVAKARRRLAAYPSERLTLSVGDAALLPAADDSYDAVVDFWILHHVPNWQAAVAEIRRVLRPGGRFFFAEVLRQALDRWSYRAFLDHPRENRFSAEELLGEVERRGIAVGESFVHRNGGDFLFAVGRRSAAGGRFEEELADAPQLRR